MTGEQILRLRDQLRTTRTPLEGHWDDLSELYMPFRLSDSDTPDIPSADSVSDSTAREVALILANGLASLIIPREEVWFEWAPPKFLEADDDAIAWYRGASATTREFIERSNFYEEAQEFLIESPVYGTAAMFVGDMDETNGLYFRHQPVKTYYIAEDAFGRVTIMVREIRLTPDQAAQEFGEENLPRNIRNKIGKPEGMTEKSVYVHAVMPQKAKNQDAPESERKAFSSYVVEETSKKVVATGGYDEFPFAVHRFRRFGRIPWGFGPGTTGIADARQLNFLEKLADAAAEKGVFPPLIAPSALEGEIGQGTAEVTYVDENNPNQAAILREWATTARYDYAKDRLSDKRDQLRKVFHTDLFQLFAARAMERSPLTATESQLINGEKMSQFSPTFGRLVSEFLTPTLTRIFAVLMRKNAFGPIPPSILTPKGIPAPDVRYKNRIMLAMEQRNNESLMQYVALVSPIVQLDPSKLDVMDSEAIMRDTARNAGFPESWIRSKKEYEAIQQARAEAAEAQRQAELAQGLAKAGKDASQIDPNKMNQMQ